MPSTLFFCEVLIEILRIFYVNSGSRATIHYISFALLSRFCLTNKQNTTQAVLIKRNNIKFLAVKRCTRLFRQRVIQKRHVII